MLTFRGRRSVFRSRPELIGASLARPGRGSILASTLSRSLP
jgi:hypothetical protein